MLFSLHLFAGASKENHVKVVVQGLTGLGQRLQQWQCIAKRRRSRGRMRSGFQRPGLGLSGRQAILGVEVEQFQRYKSEKNFEF